MTSFMARVVSRVFNIDFPIANTDFRFPIDQQPTEIKTEKQDMLKISLHPILHAAAAAAQKSR